MSDDSILFEVCAFDASHGEFVEEPFGVAKVDSDGCTLTIALDPEGREYPAKVSLQRLADGSWTIWVEEPGLADREVQVMVSPGGEVSITRFNT